MYKIEKDAACALVDLWYELDKYLYFGLKYCDGESLKAYHEQLRPLIENGPFDQLCWRGSNCTA